MSKQELIKARLDRNRKANRKLIRKFSRNVSEELTFELEYESRFFGDEDELELESSVVFHCGYRLHSFAGLDTGERPPVHLLKFWHHTAVSMMLEENYNKNSILMYLSPNLPSHIPFYKEHIKAFLVKGGRLLLSQEAALDWLRDVLMEAEEWQALFLPRKVPLGIGLAAASSLTRAIAQLDAILPKKYGFHVRDSPGFWPYELRNKYFRTGIIGKVGEEKVFSTEPLILVMKTLQNWADNYRLHKDDKNLRPFTWNEEIYARRGHYSFVRTVNFDKEQENG